MGAMERAAKELEKELSGIGKVKVFCYDCKYFNFHSCLENKHEYISSFTECLNNPIETKEPYETPIARGETTKISYSKPGVKNKDNDCNEYEEITKWGMRKRNMNLSWFGRFHKYPRRKEG